MALKLSDLTSSAAVQAALDEYERLGKERFLRKHGFREAGAYLVRNPRTQGLADSKAIAGVALAHQYPGSGGLSAASFSGGANTVQRRLEHLGFEVVRSAASNGGDWSSEEVAAIVADYLAMLLAELAGQTVNKSAHRRALMSKLDGRSEAAIEFKHANISAAMLELSLPYIKGYQPRANFQREALLREIELQVAQHQRFDVVASDAVKREAIELERDDFAAVKEDAPERVNELKEPMPWRPGRAFKRDYLEQEASNRSLGRAGEDFVVRYERWRLLQLGLGQLAEKVEHVTKTRGAVWAMTFFPLTQAVPSASSRSKRPRLASEHPFSCHRTSWSFRAAKVNGFGWSGCSTFAPNPGCLNWLAASSNTVRWIPAPLGPASCRLPARAREPVPQSAAQDAGNSA